jgi:HEAT repeat protein
LYHFARQAAKVPEGPVPVLVSLRDYAAYRADGNRQSLLSFALEEAARRFGLEGRRLLQILEDKVEAQQILWLVDSLDEARGWRVEAARETANLPGRLILTSRPAGYERSGLEGLPHFEILALTVQDTEQFMRNWFSIMADRRDEGQDWIDGKVNWLQGQLAHRPRISALIRSPLLLTFLVVLAGEEPSEDLPKVRAELYRRYVEELLATWEQVRRSRPEKSGQEGFQLGSLVGEDARWAALAGFHRMGWKLHLIYYGGHGSQFSVRDEVIADLARFLGPDWNLGDGEARALAGALLGFWQEAGLIECWRLMGQEYLAFRHLTFQEYAAATTLCGLWQEQPQRTWAFLRPRVHHYAWREVILLVASVLSDRHEVSTPQVKVLLKARSPYERALRRDLKLAAEWTGEGARLDPALVQKMIRRLSRLASPRSQWKRGGVLIAFYLAALWLFWQAFPWWWAVLAGLAWSGAWVLSFYSTSWPRVRAVLRLPTRLFGLKAENLEALMYLGRLGGYSVRLLSQALQDSDRRVSEAAAEALGYSGSLEAAKSLVGALRDDRPDVRQKASAALVQIGGPAVSPLVKLLGQGDIASSGLAGETLERIGALAVEPLIQALGSGSSQVRERAAGMLGRIGDNRAVEPLLSLLEDDSSDVRRVVIRALGQIGDARAVEPLMEALCDADGTAHGLIAESLGWIGDVRATEALLNALQSGDIYLRRKAAEALTALEWEPSEDSLATQYWIARQQWLEVAKIGQSTVPSLLRVFEEGDSEMRQGATLALGYLGAIAVEPLLRALAYGDNRQSTCVAEALGHTRDERTTLPLVLALEDENSDLRESAAVALGRIGDLRAVEPLMSALEDEAWRVRRAAAEALGRLGDARAIESLVWVMGTYYHPVRQAAAQALVCIGEPAVKPLLQRLGYHDKDVRRRAAEALGSIGDEQATLPLVTALSDRAREVRKSAAVALGRIGDQRATKALGRALEDEEWSMRRVAAGALGCIGCKHSHDLLSMAVETLLLEAGEGAFPMRWEAVEMLGQIGKPAMELSLSVLDSEYRDVRDTAMEALVRLGDAATPIWLQALSSQHSDVLRASAAALDAVDWKPSADAQGAQYWIAKQEWVNVRQLGDVALDPLVQALRIQDNHMHQAVVQTLTQSGESAQVLLMQALNADDSTLREGAIEVLGAMGWAKATEQLLWVLKADEESRVRQAAAVALGRIGDVRAVNPLRRATRDPEREVRRAAVEALGRIRAVPTARFLLRALGDRSWDVRSSAAEALGNTADLISSHSLARRTSRRLWWRLTDLQAGSAAYESLHRVVARLTELVVMDLPREDPSYVPSQSRWRALGGVVAIVGVLIAFWLVDLATNVLTELITNELDIPLPSGLGGMVFFAVGIVILLLLSSALRKHFGIRE